MNESRRSRLSTIRQPGETDDAASSPERLCQICAGVVGVDGAGLSLMTDELHPEMVGASDDVATRIEELQLTWTDDLGGGRAVVHQPRGC